MKYILKILLFLLFLFINLSLFNFRFKRFVIEVDISGKEGGRGPSNFVRGLNFLLPYNTSRCIFIPSSGISPYNGKNKTDFFYMPYPFLSESTYEIWVNISKIKNLLLGPCFVPNFWNNFPNNYYWKERRFWEILKAVKGIIVHTSRVRNHLAQKSNNTDLIKKFIIVRPCTNIIPKNVKSFTNRTIDIIFYEKYEDLNRRKQAFQLLELFKNNSMNIFNLIYGNYTKEQMQELANNSKFIIYFSFYDTGAISLKEFQNYGVFAFSHQKDLVIHKDTSFFIPELSNENNLKPAYIKIIEKIKIILKSNPNTMKIAKINQQINKCENALDDLCKGLQI